MREQLKAFAPYISVFGLVVLLASALAPRLIQQSGGSAPDWLGTALAVLGLVLALAWPVLRFDEAKALLGTRQARYGGNALVLVVAVIAILAALNFIATRYYGVWDMTTNKQFSVSRQTVQILDDLKANNQTVQVTGLFSPGALQAAEDVERLIDRYRQRHSGITFTRLDPVADRTAVMGLAGRLKLDANSGLRDRSLIVEAGEKHTVANNLDEQGITEAIVKVTRTKEPVVAFTAGHGEFDPNGTADKGYSAIRQRLERDGYKVETLSLATVSTTLTADVVVVAGPQRPLSAKEAGLLANFVQSGGSALLMLDPGVEAGIEPVMLPWAIRPDNDMVLQANLFGQASSVVAVQGQDYGFHAVTRGIEDIQADLPSARSLTVGQAVSTTYTTTPLIEVKRGAWGETDLVRLQQGAAQPDEGVDKLPPLTLAVAAEGGENVGRLVVFGSATMASDAWLQQAPGGANADLVPNAINWLTRDENLISIRPTEADSRPITPPQNPYLLLIVAAGLVPLTIFGIGFWIFWRRR